MRNWGKKQKDLYSDLNEIDISGIDQSVFDDPVLLLEYLEKQEAEKKKGHEKVLIHTTERQDITTSRRVYQVDIERDVPLLEKQSISIDKPEVEKNNINIAESDSDNISVYSSVDDFLLFIMSKGVLTKDNRWNDGCVWVQADPQIEMIMKKVYIKGRQFKYASKCRAFSGEPGWYY